MIVSSPSPIATPSTTVSNGTAPSILLDVDCGTPTLVVQSIERQPVRVDSAPQLERSVSDNAEARSNAQLVMACDNRSAVSLLHDLSQLDATKL